MVKRRGGFVVNGNEPMNRKDLIDFLKSHPKLKNCQLKDLGNTDGTGRLIWARNPGSVYWPALIAKLEDEPGAVPEKEGENLILPEEFRCVMFLETAFRFAVLQWKDIILVDEANFEEQCELVYQLNIYVIKKNWKKEKPYKDAVELLKEFTLLSLSERQPHAFKLSMERKESKVSYGKSRKSETKLKVDIVEQSPPEVKLRHSETYGLRQNLRPPVPFVINLSDSDSVASTAEIRNGSCNRNTVTPSPSLSASSGSETLSDISSKHKIRPKVGGTLMKQYVEERFMSIDKSFKFSCQNGINWKCAACLEDINDGKQTFCHDLPHHPECLFTVVKTLKDGSTQQQFKCKCCAEQACYVCKKTSVADEKSATKCSKCELRYHRQCLLSWPQAVVQGSSGPITCPTHFCHTCVGEHYVLRKVRNCKAFSKEGRYRCIQCPATYHKPHCLPAGCGGEAAIGRDYVICPKHVLPNLKITQRRFGCLTCGQNLKATNENRVDCNLCLQVFHPECVGYSEEHIKNGVSLQTFGRDYKCSSCFWGLFPLYGQAVWFQQPSSKFWPARILFPRESCGRIDFAMDRETGLYSVKYFGPIQSYYDKASRTTPLSLATVKLFTTVKVYQEENIQVKSAFDEAGFYAALLDEMRDQLLPAPEPFYKKIDKNIYRSSSVSTARKVQDQVECFCGEAEEGAVCTITSGCHNRDTSIECNDDNCTGGERCQNRMFTQKNKDLNNTEQFLTPGKGWAVKASKGFIEGEFIIEYCGEIINNAEMQYRANRKTEEDPLYILEIDKHTFIDAEFCGNVSRLINHSCEPNCRIEKYTSEGRPVVGVFAHTDIPKGEELTFDYAYGNNSSAPFRCHCGTSTCRGYIGKRVAESELEIVDVVNLELEKYDKECAKCFFGGHVLCCDYEDCFKVYHKSCAGLSREPQNEWFCPDHKVLPKAGKKRRASSRPSSSDPPPTKKILLTVNK